MAESVERDGDLCGERERFKSSMTIPKAISLITNKHSSEMTERHIRALNRIAIKNKHGFFLKDVSNLSKLLAVCASKVYPDSEYSEALCKLLELCSLPFLKEKASDENTYAPQMIEVLTTFGQLACGENESVRAQVAKTVSSFYTEQTNHALLEGLQATKLTFNAILVERSAIAKSFIEAYCKCKEQKTRDILLQTIQILSTTPANCNHMLLVGAAQIICDSLTLLDPEQQTLFAAVEILWNLLENGSQIQVANQLSTRKCIRLLKDVLVNQMTSASSMQSKQLRNDILMICLRVAQICPDAPFVETGFLRDLCLFANFPEENGSHPHLEESLRGLKLTQHHEDFEMKKGLMCLLSSLSSDLAASKVMIEEKVVRGLLSYVTRNDKVVAHQWNPAQFEELQLLALSCLSSLAPMCVEDYMTCQGNTRLLMLIEWCTKEEGNFKGYGNGFHSDGGRGTKLSQLRYSLRLLLSMCNCGDDMVHLDLHEQGAIPLLLGVLKLLLEQPSPTANSQVVLEMQADILLITSCICELDVHRKELFGGYDGVKLLVDYLKRDTDIFIAGQGHHKILLAAVDCVWCTVVGNAIVEDMFLEKEGVLVLLDILNTCPDNMKNLVLGVIVDLCENPKAIPHVAAWRTSDKCSVWSLLARLWRSEELEMEVPRGVMDTLAGTQQPLVGVEQNACGVPPIPSNCPSAAIIDVTENMRAKIYALCCKLGFNYHSDELLMKDKVTLHIIEGYLDFKAGEVWYEVAGELAQEGVRPVTPDQECLTEIWQTYEEKAEEILKKQHEVIEEQEKRDCHEELEFYERIQQLHKMEEKAERDFKKFVQRTSNYASLKEAKKHQLKLLDASRRSSVAIGDRFHGLKNHNLNVTTFCGRQISIATTPMKLLSAQGTIVASQKHPGRKTLLKESV